MDRGKYFDIEKFLEKAAELEWLDLISYTNSEVRRAEVVIRKLKRYDPDEYSIRKFYDFVHESSYYFTMGGIPAAMKKEDFQRLKPITEHLVAMGAWKADSLDSFQ